MFDFIKNNPLTFIGILVLIAAPGLLIGAIKVIGYIVLAIIIILVVLGFIFRAKIRKLQRQMEEQMRGGQQRQNHAGGFYQNFTSQRSQNKSREEGKVDIVNKEQANKKRISQDVGDYVDFEDIKEK